MNETENLQQSADATADPGSSQDHGDQGGGSGAETIEGLDISQIPEAARPLVINRLKEMRADHTRKTMEASERLKEAEALRQKAALADLMLQNPNVRNLVNGGQPQNGGSNQSDDEDEAAIESLEPKAKRAVEALLRKWRKTELAPIYDPLIERFTSFERKQIKSEWDSVTREFPEAKEHQAEVVAFLQANPSIGDLRQAVMASVGAKILEARSQASKKADLTMRQNAQTQRNGTPAPQTQPKEKPKFSRLAEALAALEDSKKAGRT